ncbi:MAG: DUF4465 domain-containing protein [Bacteroidales bacterium]|nr:DUF4465 domain-containing protein [Bacteroidales bacterium]
MKNSIKILLLSSAMIIAGSCNKFSGERSNASFDVDTSFELTDTEIEKYLTDGLMFGPSFTFDQVIYFMSGYEASVSGYTGGFLLSNRTEDDPGSDSNLASYTTACPDGGALTSRCYMVYRQTSTTPEFDIKYDFTSYYSGNAQIVGCYICNTLYNKRLGEDGDIKSGDFLKVTFEFYNHSTLLGSVEKYLVDYTGSELIMVNDWEPWDMNKQMEDEGGTPENTDAVKIKVTCSGASLKPEFCMDSFVSRVNVVY